MGDKYHIDSRGKVGVTENRELPRAFISSPYFMKTKGTLHHFPKVVRDISLFKKCCLQHYIMVESVVLECCEKTLFLVYCDT